MRCRSSISCLGFLTIIFAIDCGTLGILLLLDIQPQGSTWIAFQVIGILTTHYLTSTFCESPFLTSSWKSGSSLHLPRCWGRIAVSARVLVPRCRNGNCFRMGSIHEYNLDRVSSHDAYYFDRYQQFACQTHIAFIACLLLPALVVLLYKIQLTFVANLAFLASALYMSHVIASKTYRLIVTLACRTSSAQLFRFPLEPRALAVHHMIVLTGIALCLASCLNPFRVFACVPKTFRKSPAELFRPPLERQAFTGQVLPLHSCDVPSSLLRPIARSHCVPSSLKHLYPRVAPHCRYRSLMSFVSCWMSCWMRPLGCALSYPIGFTCGSGLGDPGYQAPSRLCLSLSKWTYM